MATSGQRTDLLGRYFTCRFPHLLAQGRDDVLLRDQSASQSRTGGSLEAIELKVSLTADQVKSIIEEGLQRAGFVESIAELGRQTDEDTATWSGYLNALRKARLRFRAHRIHQRLARADLQIEAGGRNARLR